MHKGDSERPRSQSMGRRLPGRRRAENRVSAEASSCSILLASNIASIILVQGLNAHPYYTWVGHHKRPEHKTTQSARFASLRGLLRGGVPADRLEDDLPISSSQEVFWPKDLLPRHLPSSSIATYSYPSNWLSREFATDLRRCGEQLLNVLFQHRQTNKVRWTQWREGERDQNIADGLTICRRKRDLLSSSAIALEGLSSNK